MRVLNGGGANVGNRFQRLQVAFTEGIGLVAIERQNAHGLPKRNQRNIDLGGRGRKQFVWAKVRFDGGAGAGENAGPGLAAGRKTAALKSAGRKPAMMRAKNQIMIFPQQ